MKSFSLSIALFAALLIGCLSFGAPAHASTGDNVTGWAWSYNVGWISFNCTNTDSCFAFGAGELGGGPGGGDMAPGAKDTGGTHIEGYNTLQSRPAFSFSSLKNSLHKLFAFIRPESVLAEGDLGDLTTGASYGVQVDPATGVMSGWAWNNNVGWISFNEYTGCPDGACTPKIDLATNKLSGWIKAVGADAGTGWDGWISLSCNNTDWVPWCVGSNYRVTFDPVTGNLNGYAWGDDVVGWMKFSGDSYAVHVDIDAPTVSLSGSAAEYCPGDTYTLSWNATEPVTTCTASSTNGDPAFSGTIPLSGTATVSPSSPSTTYTITCTAPGTDAAYQDSVTVNYGTCAGSKLVLSAEPTPAQCTNGYKTTLTLFSPSHTSFTSCTPLAVTPGGTPIPLTTFPNATNGYSVTIPSVYVPSNPTTFSTTCTEEGTGTPTPVTTSVARTCAAPTCSFTDFTLSGSPLKTSLTWTSSGASGTGLTASGGWSGTKAFSGTQGSIAFTSPETTYSLTATNLDGATFTCSATLNSTCDDPDPNDPNGAECDPSAVVTLHAAPMTLPDLGGPTNLSWTSHDVTPDSCVGYSWPTVGSWNGPKTDNGSQSALITTTTTFRVQCDDPYHLEDAYDDVVVTVPGTTAICDDDPTTLDIPDCACTDPAICPDVRTKPWYIER